MRVLDAPTIRAEIARCGIAKYKLAALAEVHPCRLAGMLTGRVPLPRAVAEKILRALDDAGAAGPEVVA